MKLKNVSHKVISIGTTVLMPDKEIPITKQRANLPSVKALVKAGFLTVDDSEERIAAAKKEAADTARKEAEEKAAAEAALKKQEEDEKRAAADKKNAEKKADKASTEQK